jgi:hypothetical protein
MKAAQVTSLVVLEAVGLFMIFRLWSRGSKSSLSRRIVWSTLLLIPLIGPLLYGFVSLDPSEHGEDVGDRGINLLE